MSHEEDTGQEHCDVCGEPLDGEVAEMYDPRDTATEHPEHYIVHAQCGIDAGYEIA